MYFLTDLDPNVDVKGSRDPLGFQPIWQAIGRQLVAHLTTSTTSLRGFSVLLLGLELAERALEARGGMEHEAREAARLAYFLRFEQLAAYSRHVTHPHAEIRGINRVKRRLQEGQSIVTIGEADRHQILAEQRTYGLWGLYMSAARGSGLVEEADARPTTRAREYVDAALVAALGRSTVADLIKRIREEGRSFEPRGRDRKVAGTLGAALGPAPNDAERGVMRDALMHVYEDHDLTGGAQKLLWQTMRVCGRAKSFAWRERCDYDDVVAFHARAPAGSSLANALDAIIAIEPLLATSETLFNHLVGRREVTYGAAVAALKAAWGADSFRHLRSDAVSRSSEVLETVVGAEARDRLSSVLSALRRDRFEDAISGLLDQNDAVMRSRGGAGWFERTGPTLRARVFLHRVDLPEREQLRGLWRNSYFLDALRWIGADIESLQLESRIGN